MSSPKPDDIRTEAGQALFHRPLIHTTYCAVKHGKAYRDCICGVTEAILAIENEAYNSGVLDQKLSLGEAHAATARPFADSPIPCPLAGCIRTLHAGDDHDIPGNGPKPDTTRPVEPPDPDWRALYLAMVNFRKPTIYICPECSRHEPEHTEACSRPPYIPDVRSEPRASQPDTARPVEPHPYTQEQHDESERQLATAWDRVARAEAQVTVLREALESYIANSSSWLALRQAVLRDTAAAGYGLVEPWREFVEDFCAHPSERNHLLNKARALLDTEKEDGE